MTNRVKRILIFFASILLSILSYYFLTGWVNIIPWAIVALYIGYSSDGRRNTIINGAIFGYFLFLAYILIGYGGKTDTKSIFTIILFALVFSLIGSVAGICGALVGNLTNQKVKTLYKTDKV